MGLNRGLAGRACPRPRGRDAGILKAHFPPLKTPLEGNNDGRGGSSANRVAPLRSGIYLCGIIIITGANAFGFRPSKNMKKRLVIRLVECYHDQAISLSGSAKTFSTVVEIPVEK